MSGKTIFNTETVSRLNKVLDVDEYQVHYHNSTDSISQSCATKGLPWKNPFVKSIRHPVGSEHYLKTLALHLDKTLLRKNYYVVHIHDEHYILSRGPTDYIELRGVRLNKLDTFRPANLASLIQVRDCCIYQVNNLNMLNYIAKKTHSRLWFMNTIDSTLSDYLTTIRPSWQNELTAMSPGTSTITYI